MARLNSQRCVVLIPFETILVSSISESRQHRKRVNVMMERVEGSLGDEVVPVNSYSILYPGSTRAKVALRKHDSQGNSLESQNLCSENGCS